MLEDLAHAFRMLTRMDREVMDAIRVTVSVSFFSTLLATVVGIPFGFLVAVRGFAGKRVVIMILQTLFALPTVLVGLIVMTFLSRRGPLGSFGLRSWMAL